MLPSWVGIPLTVLIVVYITNAINLIDGIDGLASGLSCIALTVLAAICISNGSYFYALLALATLGILIPFWFYNVFGNAQRGHKLFMGDTGSLTIGYILSFLVIQLSVVHSDGEVRTNPYMVIAWFLFLMSSVWCCIDYVKAGIPSYRIRITSIISCCGLVCVSVRYW